MLLPTDLSPEKLNLTWGMKFDPALYERSGSDSTFDWAEVSHNVAGEKHSISLFFDAQGLGCITCVVLQSEWVSDYEEEKIEAISRNYTQIFHQMVTATNALLGAPDLLLDESNKTEGEYISLPDNQGIMRIRTNIPYDIFSEDVRLNPTYCKWLSNFDYPVAFWSSGDSRHQIGQNHEIEECPVTLTVSVTRLDH